MENKALMTDARLCRVNFATSTIYFGNYTH